MAVTILGFPKPTPLPERVMSVLSNLQKMKSQQLQNQFYPQLNNAKLALLGAQTRRANQLANLPFGGNYAPGIAGQIEGLKTIAYIYGVNSPEYQQAQKAFDLQQRATSSRIGYQNALVNSLPLRYTTQTGKSAVEEQRTKAGLSPTGQTWNAILQPVRETPPVASSQTGLSSSTPPITTPGASVSPGFNQQLSNQYELLRQKKTSDTNTRQRNLYARNIEKTYQQIDPISLTQYAGARGSLEKGVEGFLAPFNKESKNYDDYQKNLVAASLLANQIRQFYGDSIQPAMLQRLEMMTNPAAWKNNPRLALQNFYAIKNILTKEMQTYRSALQNRNVYLGKDIDARVPRRTDTQYVRVISPSGQRGKIPANQLNDALQQGYKRVNNG